MIMVVWPMKQIHWDNDHDSANNEPKTKMTDNDYDRATN